MTEAQMLEANRAFYDPLWAQSRLISPERFNTWPLVQRLAAEAPCRLEIGPGLRPRLPLEGTQFVDLSSAAVQKLAARGAIATVGPISALPFEGASFDLVCALDIIEHVEADEKALEEITRVLRPGGRLLAAVPLHMEKWTPFDDLVGHYRRYEPEAFLAMLERHGFTVEQSADYGMQPKSTGAMRLAMWFLRVRRGEAMWWYNRIFMPIGLFFQKELTLRPGWPDLTALDQVLFICRRN